MGVLVALLSLALIAVVLADGFETMVLPRRVTRSFRTTRYYYRGAWTLWRACGLRLPAGRQREGFLSFFGPLSLLGLFALWITLLILGFGLLHWSLGTALTTPDGNINLRIYLYESGVTFFTLGYSDIMPAGPGGRFLAVLEAGMGLGFLAIIIGYLPVLYQAFSHREGTISLLDARAGSPPTAAQFLLRMAGGCSASAADPFLAEWERWAAELLESHLSFPVLCYYRSQHDNQNWVAALTAVLDICALLIVEGKGCSPHQAQLTFAMARHAAVDLGLVFHTPPQPPEPDRLPAERLARLRALLKEAGRPLPDGPEVDKKLAELRELYEPFVNALARFFVFNLPPILSDKPVVDNWQTSAWARRAPGIGRLPAADEHFD
jgi:hypothetical protein